jgi:tetratricopeptide (TPR) repeat protein
MRQAIWLTGALLLVFALPAQLQLGKSVPIKAGTPEDKALSEINAATDPAQKLALIDKFAAELGTGDMATVASDLYVNYYLSTKNYDKAFEYGEKVWALDPDNFSNGVNLVRGAQEKGDLAKLFLYSEKTGAILARFKAQAAPEGTTEAAWEQQKSRVLGDLRDDLNYIEQSVFMAAYRSPNAATRAGSLLRFATAFPDSVYASQAQGIAAASYQQAQQYAKMLEVANRLLAKDSNDLSMLILLSDYYSEKGEQLDKAEAYATKAIELLGKAKKPEGVTDEQWQQQSSLQKGLALSALGQVNIQKKNNVQALENLKKAGPLLKPDPSTYGRNQYRLGFALLNLKRVAEGRAALAEAASIKSPYQGLAQEKLNSLPPGPERPARKKP